MKTITLLFNRIKQFTIKKKTLFILFILGGIINSVMFAYMYGNFNPVLRNYYSKAVYYRKYEVVFTWSERNNVQNGSISIENPDKNYVEDEDINRIIDTGLFETIVVESIYPKSSLSVPVQAQNNPLPEQEPTENAGQNDSGEIRVEDIGDGVKVIYEPGDVYGTLVEPPIVINGVEVRPEQRTDLDELYNNPNNDHSEENPVGYEPWMDNRKKQPSVDISQPEGISQPEPVQHSEEENIPESVYACVYGEPSYIVVKNGTRDFSNNNQVVVDSSIQSAASVGDKITIRGEEFEVIGRCTDSRSSSLITKEKYKEFGAYTNHIILYSTDRWHLNNNVPVLTLQKLFPEAKILYSENEERDMLFAKREMPSVFLNYAVTLIAFVFLLDYLTSQLNEENAVSLIVGGRPTDITIMAILEGSVLSIVSLAIGLILHYVLYEPIFSKLSTSEIYYHVSDYVLMFLIMTIISLVVMVVRSFKYLKVSPFRLRAKVTSNSKLSYVFVIAISVLTLYSCIMSSAGLFDLFFNYRALKTCKLKNAYYSSYSMSDNDMLSESLALSDKFKSVSEMVQESSIVDKVYVVKSARYIEHEGSLFSIVLYEPGFIDNFPLLRKYGINFSKDPNGVVLSRVGATASAKRGESLEVSFINERQNNNELKKTVGELVVVGKTSYPYKSLTLNGGGTNLNSDHMFMNDPLAIMQATDENMEMFENNTTILYTPGFIFTIKEDASEEEIDILLNEIRQTSYVDSFNNIIQRSKDDIINRARVALIRPIFLMFATLIAYLSVIIIMIMRKQKDMAISYLCGASKKNLISEMFRLCLAVSGVPTILAILFIMFAPGIQRMMMESPVLSYDVVVIDQIWIVLAYFVLTIIISLAAVIISIGRKSPLVYLRGLE